MAKGFDTAAEILGLDEGLREVLRQPDRELKVALPILMDDGSTRVFTGYRVQHNFLRGPCKMTRRCWRACWPKILAVATTARC